MPSNVCGTLPCPHLGAGRLELRFDCESLSISLEDALSISNLTYSEPGSPFPDCRERLADRLSNSVLLPGIDPWTGRKTDAAITTELMPDPSQWKEKKACSVAWGGFNIHASADGLRPIADMCWRHTAFS